MGFGALALDWQSSGQTLDRMKTHNTNQETPGTPLEAFDTIYMNLATIGWKNIAADINSLGKILIFPSSGLVLCAFAISYIDRTPTFKLPHITLDQGTECIKQLYEIRIATSTELSDLEKIAEIQWHNEFFDTWRCRISDALEQKGLLIG